MALRMIFNYFRRFSCISITFSFIEAKTFRFEPKMIDIKRTKRRKRKKFNSIQRNLFAKIFLIRKKVFVEHQINFQFLSLGFVLKKMIQFSSQLWILSHFCYFFARNLLSNQSIIDFESFSSRWRRENAGKCQSFEKNRQRRWSFRKLQRINLNRWIDRFS